MNSIAQQPYSEGYAFDFFQAVRLMERMHPERRAIGRSAPPSTEAVRFKVLPSMVTPASEIYEIEPANARIPVPSMTVTFMGLTGSLGTLPLHYTELLIRQQWGKGEEKSALRDWLDMFNNRLIALFYRAWEKYRFYIGFERETRAGETQADPFTSALFSFIGLRDKPLRGRLHVAHRIHDDAGDHIHRLASIEDLALLHYGGLLSHRPRHAIGLEAILRDYFQLPARVTQFAGQWLTLTSENQSRIGACNSALGIDVVIGDSVWDVQSKFRIRLGPMSYDQFLDFLPDRNPTAERKAFFLFCQFVRLYVGAELDFDVQLVLKSEDVPICRLSDAGIGPRLGWNTWVASESFRSDADDAVFAGIELVNIN